MQTDRKKAVGYVEQAISVLEDHSSESDDHEVAVSPITIVTELIPRLEFVPMDERQWLLGTTYNTGIECLLLVLLKSVRHI